MTTSKRILVIEDDQLTRGWLGKILSAEGFSVTITGSLKHGQELLSMERDFAAIVCNYSLPDGNCQDLLNTLRIQPEIFVPVLLISGSWVQWIESLPGTPGVQVLNKPFDGVQLLAVLHRLLRDEPTENARDRDSLPAPPRAVRPSCES